MQPWHQATGTPQLAVPIYPQLLDTSVRGASQLLLHCVLKLAFCCGLAPASSSALHSHALIPPTPTAAQGREWEG